MIISKQSAINALDRMLKDAEDGETISVCQGARASMYATITAAELRDLRTVAKGGSLPEERLVHLRNAEVA